MRYHDGEVVLRKMLTDARLVGTAMPFSEVWGVFRVFARIPIEEELPTRDGLTFTSGTEEASYLCVLRSMSRAFRMDRGEDEWGDKVETVEELFTSFYFPRQMIWTEHEIDSWDFPNLDAFFAEVETTDVFRQAHGLGTAEIAIAQSTLY